MNDTSNRPILVLGAGIAGLTAALEAAETGRFVVLVEKNPWVGGRVAAFHQYFPKLCPPSCGLEINIRRLERNPRIRLLTGTRLAGAERIEGGWRVILTRAPRWVTDRCTACGECTAACPVEIPNPFDQGMGTVKAIHRPHAQSWPERFVMERDACRQGCHACADACEYGAIDLAAEATTEELEVGSVVVATGWEPYPLEKLPELGGGVLPDVISNVQMERLAHPGGPTGGRILRPSDGAPPRRVAFVQCAGSRDVNHLAYCSGVCCLASLKEALYVREQLPGAEIAIYYIDRRTPGRNEDFLEKVAGTEGIRLVKGKVGKVLAADGGLELVVEDVEAGRRLHERADLVVLATGMVPSAGDLPLPVELDEDGFVLDDPASGVVPAGVVHRPQEVASVVRDATGASARAMAMAGGRA